MNLRKQGASKTAQQEYLKTMGGNYDTFTKEEYSKKHAEIIDTKRWENLIPKQQQPSFIPP